MIHRSKLGLILGAVAAAAVIGGLAGAQTPAPAASAAPAASPGPAAKGCCQGHAGKEGHDHSKCPMHGGKAAGDTKANKHAGAAKCPFMSGEGKKAQAAPAADAKPDAAMGGFVCPMHPEVTSATKDRCPKCGMFLEQKRTSSE